MGLIQNKVTVSQPNSHVVVKNAGGLRGLTGETGPQGPQGVPGDAATVTAGTTTTLPAGSDATVQNVGSTSAAIFNFGIPKGDKGDTGESGAAATISVGTTTTLEPGEDATVTNSGTSSAAVFDFGIPKGDKGDTGATGADGYSPSATVTKTGDTATITITDKDGTTTASISDGATPTVNDGTLTIQKNGTTVQTFSADQASNVTANITVPTQFSDLSGTVSSSQIADEAITTGSVTGTGTNITLTGTMDGGAIESVEMYGDTEQQTYSGKNLYEGSQDFSGTWTNSGSWTTDSSTYNGLTVKYKSAAWNGLYKEIQVENGKTYTFSVYIKAGSSRQVYIYLTGGTATTNNNYLLVSVEESWQRYSLTFTATSSGTVRPRVENTEAYETPTYICGYQLEQNSSMTSYEPYVGGMASPNPDYPQNVQTVTGEQTVTVVGKNLLDNSHPTTVSANTTWTPTANGGLYSATTGWTGGVQWRLKVEEGATYQFQYKERTNQNLYLYISTFTDATYTTVKTLIVNDGRYTKYPIVPDSPYLKITFNNSAAMTNVAIEELMFEKADERTPYAPYQGGSYPVNLGKNLLPFTNQNFTLKGVTFTVTNGTLYLDGTSQGETYANDQTFKDNFSFTLQPGTYTFSRNNSHLVTAQIKKFSDGTNIASTNGTYLTSTFTLTEPTKVVFGFYMYQNVFDNVNLELMLEKGSTATTYAPYFTPIELCKIGTYQDYIYKSGEDWYVKKNINKLALNGSESWETTGTNVYALYVSGGIKSVAEGLSGVCDYYTFNPVQTNVTITLTTGQFAVQYINPNTQHRLFMKNTAISTTSDFQTWLGTHNTKVYYPLATPTDTQITDATLIAQLEDLLSATTYSGNTYITVSGDLASPLEVVAEADSKLAPDSVYGAAIKDGAVSVDKIADLQALADALAPYLNS